MDSENITFYHMIPFIAIFILFLYFGYRDDYKRNPNEFAKTIIGVPLGVFASVLGGFGLVKIIKDWIKGNDKKKPKS